MEDYDLISPPEGVEDTAGARRVFGEFVIIYHPLLLRVEEQLDAMVDQVDPRFAQGYRPWQTALHDLLRGAFLIARNVQPPNPRRFYEALLMFSLPSAAEFIHNICMESRFPISRQWVEKFSSNIRMLAFALSILNRDYQAEIVR
ncbi:MAG: hypothetical protein AB7L92_05385 [Alphaproteobacteria bacterium]